MLWAVVHQMEVPMKALEGIKKVFDKILEILGTITLGIMTILVVYQVVTRYVFNAPSAFSEALAQYLFVWMIMFGSAYVYGSKEHLTIDLLKDKFPPKMNMVVEIITNICLFAFILLVCVKGGYPRSSVLIRPCTFPWQRCTSLSRSRASLRSITRFTTLCVRFRTIKKASAS